MSDGKNLTVKEAFDLAIQNHLNNNLQDAKNYYNKVLEIDPNHLSANNNLGVLFQGSGDIQKAKACYEKAIAINPNYVDGHNNLGIIFKELGENQKAIDCYEKAIKINPTKAEAHNNLGAIFKELGENKKAKSCYENAIKINPNDSNPYTHLGTIFLNLKEYQRAEDCYAKSIELKPNSPVALINRGLILFEKGEFELSLIDFDNCNTIDSRSMALSSLYALGKIEDIYARIKKNFSLDEKNLRVAAFSSFIANREKRSTSHNFCLNPINFIHHSNLSLHLKNFHSFITEVIEELHGIDTIWEPYGKTTIKGSQSRPNLFVKPQKKIQHLKSIIITEIESYCLKFKNETCSFIKKWPSKYNLSAWHVILRKQGHQKLHIHPAGWLSGVIYFKIPPVILKNEGAIELGLNGQHYYDADSPKVVHQPKLGDIVLFPSSLHHRTIPFSTNTDRISIAFDLVPI